jgi:hypothetical protein
MSNAIPKVPRSMFRNLHLYLPDSLLTLLLQYDPSLGQAWIQWTTLEAELGDLERARAIYELAVQQSLDMPEIVWKVRSIIIELDGGD